jgi:hypothetical protein
MLVTIHPENLLSYAWDLCTFLCLHLNHVF